MTAFLDDEVDELAGEEIGDAQEDAGDHDEAEHDAGRLSDLLAIRPLDPLELRPACAQEAEDAIARRALLLDGLGSTECGARRADVVIVVLGEGHGGGVLDRRLAGAAVDRERAIGPRSRAACAMALAVTCHDTTS